MVSAIQIQQLVRNLNLKNEKNAIFFLSRLEGWIRDNKSSKKALARGINKILNSIHEQEKQKETEQQVKKINLDNVKNNFIIKYANLIIELNQKQGLGARKIEKFLWENHKAKVSYSTIGRFLKQQKQTIKKEKEELQNGKFKGWKFRKADKRCLF
jgi:hypothetical protein